jgi:hypothetical protein
MLAALGIAAVRQNSAKTGRSSLRDGSFGIVSIAIPATLQELGGENGRP